MNKNEKNFFTPARVNILNGILNGKPYILERKYEEKDNNYEKSLRGQMERMGFVFYDILNDDEYWLVRLPKGWTIREMNNNKKLRANHFIITDEKNFERGTMTFEGCCNWGVIRVWLYTCYFLMHNITALDEIYEITEISFGNYREKLYVAGSVVEPYNPNLADTPEEEEKLRKEKDIALLKRVELREMVKRFAEENYPDYDKYDAYWDEHAKKLMKK